MGQVKVLCNICKKPIEGIPVKKVDGYYHWNCMEVRKLSKSLER